MFLYFLFSLRTISRGFKDQWHFSGCLAWVNFSYSVCAFLCMSFFVVDIYISTVEYIYNLLLSRYQFKWSMETLPPLSTFLSPIYNCFKYFLCIHLETHQIVITFFVSIIKHNLENSRRGSLLYFLFLITVFFSFLMFQGSFLSGFLPV